MKKLSHRKFQALNNKVIPINTPITQSTQINQPNNFQNTPGFINQIPQYSFQNNGFPVNSMNIDPRYNTIPNPNYSGNNFQSNIQIPYNYYAQQPQQMINFNGQNQMPIQPFVQNQPFTQPGYYSQYPQLQQYAPFQQQQTNMPPNNLFQPINMNEAMIPARKVEIRQPIEKKIDIDSQEFEDQEYRLNALLQKFKTSQILGMNLKNQRHLLKQKINFVQEHPDTSEEKCEFKDSYPSEILVCNDNAPPLNITKAVEDSFSNLI